MATRESLSTASDENEFVQAISRPNRIALISACNGDCTLSIFVITHNLSLPNESRTTIPKLAIFNVGLNATYTLSLKKPGV